MENCKFHQINLQKSKLATNNLFSEIAVTKEPSFSLIQEQNTYTKPSIKDHTAFSKGQHPRAMIIYSSSLQVIQLPHLSSRDVSTVLWITNNTEVPKLLICSAYLDITNKEVTTDIIPSTNYANTNNIPILIGMDSNCHCQLSGSESNNKRGDILEEFIATNELIVKNVGTKPTFVNTRSQTIIDVTLTSMVLDDYLKDWEVLDQDFFSDHKMINYHLTIGKQKKTLKRNYNKANWPLFKNILEKTEWSCPTVWNSDTIEQQTSLFNEDITMALDKSCPLRLTTPKKKAVHWWTEDIAKKKKEVRLLYKLKSTGKATHEEYANERRSYYNLIRQSKKTSWNKFVTDCDIYTLNNILYSNSNRSIEVGLLRDAEGIRASNISDSLNTLFDVHMPGSLEVKPQVQTPQSTVLTKNLFNQNLHYLNNTKVRNALKEFNPKKSPGLDGIKPIVLQQLPCNMIDRLSLIYKASIVIGFVPSSWCKSKLVFIPKPGKATYDEAKSFRPISLSSFYLKGLEKLIQWELERTSLNVNPLHENQHAFRKAKSTDSAHLQLIDQIQKGLIRGQYTLGIFLDIKGAFDNLDPTKAIEAMKLRGFNEPITNWYSYYLHNRVATSELKDTKITRYLTKGCPQGGVLSSLLWNIPFDELLKIVNKNGVKGIGFADDLSLLTTGPDPGTLINLAQQATNKAIEWGKKYGLEFNHQKTIVIMFTNKRKWKAPQLKVSGEYIPYSLSVKYLGITLDSKLNFSEHVNNKIGKAKRHLMAFKNAINNKFGPSPYLMKRIYQTIVLPAFTFGCHIWGDKCKQATYQEKLRKLNRLAALTIAPVHKSTPTRGLEIIYDLMPLDLVIECRASEIMARIRDSQRVSWDGQGSRNNKGLIRRWDDAKLIITNGINQTDRIPTKFRWEKNFNPPFLIPLIGQQNPLNGTLVVVVIHPCTVVIKSVRPPSSVYTVN